MNKPYAKKRMLDLGTVYDRLSAVYCQIPYRLFPSYAFPPLHLFVELTYRCNLRCEMCQFLDLLKGKELHKNRGREISTEEISGFVRSFPPLSVVTLTGGEPLLREDIREIVASLAARNKIHIITNGTLITEDTAAFLFEHRLRSLWRGGLLAIGVSIHGPAGLHNSITGMKGALDAAVKGIGLLSGMKKKMRTAFPHVHITSVITERNAPHLAEIYELARELGVEYCNFTLFNTTDFTGRLNLGEAPAPDASSRRRVSIQPSVLREQIALMEKASRNSATALRFSPFGISPEEIARYYEAGMDLSRFRCTAPWRILGLSAYGDISSCPLMSLGNIRRDDVRKLWNGSRQREFRGRLREKRIFAVCEGCCQSAYINREKATR